MDEPTFRFLKIINQSTNPLLQTAYPRFKYKGISFDQISGKYSAETEELTYDYEKRRSWLKTLIASGFIEESLGFADHYKITDKGIDRINQ